mgnify:CR=1 FL=1
MTFARRWAEERVLGDQAFRCTCSYYWCFNPTVAFLVTSLACSRHPIGTGGREFPRWLLPQAVRELVSPSLSTLFEPESHPFWKQSELSCHAPS